MIVKRTLDIFDNPETYGLQDRVGQSEMALDIGEAIRDHRHAMIEAGVGIGKSLGYLIPSLLATQCLYGPIVIATSSIMLSEQLMTDALQAQAITGVRALPVLAKGSNNYTCVKRVVEHEEQLADYHRGYPREEFDDNLLRIPAEVLDYAKLCKDRTEFPIEVDDWVWKYINADRCLSYKCAFKADCGFCRMRQEIGDYGPAQIIIANQDLFIINQINELRDGKHFINCNKKIIIVDEAHNLEDKTRSALTERWSRMQMLAAVRNLQRPLAKVNAREGHFKILRHSETYIAQLFSSLHNKMRIIAENDPEGRDTVRYPVPGTLRKEIILTWSRWLEALVSVLTFTTNRFGSGSFSSADEEAVSRLIKLQECILHFAEREDSEANYLFWVEGDCARPQTIELCYAPKDIDRELRKLLFNNREIPVIMTSATLCQPSNNLTDAYRYIVKATGFTGETYVPKPSPFPYDTNALLYIADDLADPAGDHELYLRQVADRIAELAALTNGRTLVLFTAKTDLRTVQDILIQKKLPWKILRQKDGGAQGNTREDFTGCKGILLSTGFWEGFNVPGPDLSSVIITRLPFPVPDPIIEYKISLAADRMDVLVPEMVMKLRQGAGRLIRSEKDTGVLSILDSRASQRLGKPYRPSILKALPIKNVTEDINALAEFVKKKIVPQAGEKT